jgi:hypothetical protein
MMRLVRFIVAIAVFASVALGAMIGLQALGHIASDVADLSGRAIMAAELRGRMEDMITTYPPLPLLASLPFAVYRFWDMPPAILSAVLLAGIFGAALYYAFRGQELSRLAAFLAALLVVLNPFGIQAIAAGPGVVLLLIAMLMLGFGLFGMSGEATAPDVMMTAVALTFLAFAHPFGVFLVLASLPGLALAAPPALLARTPASLFLILLFPVAFGLFSFAYTRWALGAEPLAFLEAIFGAVPSEHSQVPQRLSRHVAEVVSALVLTAPLIVAFLLWVRRRSSQLMPAIALTGTVLLAGLLQVVLLGHVQTALVMAAALPVAGLCAARAARGRTGAVLLLLFMGVAGAVSVLASLAWLRGEAPFSLTAFVLPIQKPPAPLAAAVCSRKGVLVDTGAHPGIVELCGTAKGLVVAGEPEFDLQIQSRRLTSPFVLVGAAEMGAELDVVAHTFPDLYEHGAHGYARAFDGAGWRLYARVAPQPVS